MGEYRKASLADASIDLRGKITRSDEKDPQKEYEAAQERLKEHLAALKASGKSRDAAKVKAGIQAAQADSSLSDQLDAEIQAGFNAAKAQHVDEAIPHFQRAVDLAEKLQPHDERLMTSLDYLGMSYLKRDPAAARAALERELKAAQEMFGPESFHLEGPLQSLGGLAIMQHDYATAEKFFFRAVDVNEKTFGESSDRVANALVRATGVYFVQKDYAKAEPYLLRALHIDEALYPKDSLDLQIPLAALCGLYDRWNKPDKLDSCDRQYLGVIQKQYGASSPVLVPLLTSDAKALRSLGKETEAAQIDDRVASIRAATMKTN
jgi:tetratricopeptide (TPR) repeat protein